jgi:ADP-ribose pyrophosphatase
MRKKKLEELRTLIEELKTIEKIKVEQKGNFLQSEVYTCKLNNGKIITREKLLKGKKDGSAALILPFVNEKEVLLTVEPRVFTKRTVGISIPAGYIENGEDPKVGAARELLEETGYIGEEIIDLGGFYQDAGCSSAFNQIFLALNSKKVSEQHLDKDEYVKYFRCYFTEALELMELEDKEHNKYIEDANSIITLHKVKDYLKRR